ncbi:MAG: aldehyde dehydrogenase family protein [Crocinitomicaceae bacterium]|nr:aldehyde dehydrogenase family protein [Crocinitomicaceae bacterium]
MNILSPFDHSIVGSVELENENSLEQKIQIGKNLSGQFPQGLPKKDRIKILSRLIELMKTQIEELAILAASEGGKPISDSRVEVLRAINGVELSRDYIDQISGIEIPMNLNAASQNRTAYTLNEPIGLVVAISAFNHPLNLIVHQVVTAFAAGCPVIVKPDLRTPLSCLRLLEILSDAGLPTGWCQSFICENHLAEKLACDSRVNFMSFIGSAKIGWYLRSKLSPGTRCALEHGGLAPVIVEADADFTSMIPALVKGSFYHAGQVCVSTQRIYVHESNLEKFCGELKIAAEKMRVGNQLSDETEVGPIISKQELTRIDQWVNEAIQEGALLITGGEQILESCYKPTILLNPSEKSKISTHEIFGPVVAIYSYQNLDEAIQKANNTVYHFQAAVFSKNQTSALEIANRLNASAVMINDHTAFRVDWMPFADRDQSGLGVGGIKYSIDDMLQDKLIVIKN